MIWFALAFGVLLAADAVVLQNESLKYPKRWFSFIAAGTLTLLAGLRHETIGGRDVYLSYKRSFLEASSISWRDALRQLTRFDNYFEAETEPGYLIFEKTVAAFSAEYQIYLMAMALAFMLPLAYVIHRHSSDLFVSYVVYYVVFFSFFSLTGFRQVLATAIAVLIGHQSLISRRPWRFGLTVAAAFAFHRSALTYFLAYPFSMPALVRRGRLLPAILMSLLPFLWVVRVGALEFVVAPLGYEEGLDSDIGGTGTFVLLMVIVFSVSIWRWNSVAEATASSAQSLGVVSVGFVFAVLTLQSQAFMRVQQYFTLLLVLVIPDIINSFPKRERLVVRYLIVAALATLLLRRWPEYSFFWE